MADPVNPVTDAATVTYDITTKLVPSDTDWSVELLEPLLGHGWGHPFSNYTLPEHNAFFDMLAGFNMVVLAGVAVMVVYIMGMAVVGTAHHGKSFGERYSTLWTTSRLFFSLIALTPLPGVGGLSMIQCIVLIMVYHGIGGANYLNNIVMDEFGKSGSVVSEVKTTPDKDVMELAQNTLLGLVIQEYDKQVLHSSQSTDKWVEVVFNNTSGLPDDVRANMRSKTPSTWSYQMHLGSGFVVGNAENRFATITLYCERSGESFCTKRREGVNKMVADLQKLAAQLVTSIIKESATKPDPKYISTAYRGYLAKETEAKAAMLLLIDGEYKNKLANVVSEIKTRGWISLGSFYWTLSAYQEKLAGMTFSAPEFEFYDKKALEDSQYRDLSDHIKAITTTFQVYFESDDSKLARAREAAMSGASTLAMTQLFQQVLPDGDLLGFTDAFTEGDPLVNMQNMGHTILNTAYAAVGAWVLINTATDTTKAVSDGLGEIPIIGGLIKAGGGAAAAVAGAIKHLGVLFWFLIIPLLGSGLALAFYLPLVPFIVWTSGVIGWFVLIFESLVAGAVWAGAHVSPEGEGVAGQHAKTGYMMLLSIVLRPALMVFGFYLAFNLVSIFGHFLGESFKIYMDAMQADHLNGPITFIMMTCILAGITIMYTHKIFDLVPWIPENVMKWVGHAMHDLGEREDTATAKHMIAGYAEIGAESAHKAAGESSGGGHGGAGMRSATRSSVSTATNSVSQTSTGNTAKTGE